MHDGQAFTKSRSTGDILAIINEYFTTGKEPVLPEKGEVTVAWTLIKPLIDSHLRDVENGKKGGAKKGNKNAKKTTGVELENNPKTTPLVLENNPPASKKTTKIEKEIEKEIENNIPPVVPPKGGKFVPPTLDEVKAYIKEKGYDFDPEEFLAHYEANGWVQGNDKKTIKSWKACCVTWKKNSKRYDAPNKNSYHDKAYGTDQIVEVGF